MSVVFTVLLVAVIECDNEDSGQLNKLLVALEVDQLRRPNMFNAEVIANLVLRPGQSTHIDANLRVPVESLITFVTIWIAFEPLPILSQS